MERATDVLRHEHDAILQMLEVAENLAERLGQNQAVSPQHLADVLEFFRTFADRCHHGKEENLLFPALEAKGLPREGGPIGVMLHEHDFGREMIRQMADAAQAYARGNTEAGKVWAGAALNYIALLRQHIQKENDILFVMAEQMLSDAEQTKLAAGFDRLEEEKIGASTHERLHQMMDRLAAEVLGR